MKKVLISVLLIILVIICSLGVFADHPFDHPWRDGFHHDRAAMDRDARYIIHRT